MQPTPPDPWPSLIARIQSGQPEATDVWYRREWPNVYRLCLGFLADHSAAEDAAQDAMLRLADRLSAGVHDLRDYEKWRTTVVLNLCRDALRRRARRDRAESEPPPHLAGRTLPNPHDLADQAEVRATLQGALKQLSEREREAFVLRDLQGLSTDEAANAMQIAASSVRSLLTLARRRLRTVLSPDLAPGFMPNPSELLTEGGAS